MSVLRTSRLRQLKVNRELSTGPAHLNMQPLLLCKQFLYSLAVHLIGHATVHGADGRALRLFMEALAFGAFIGNDVINIAADGRIALSRIDHGAVEQGKGPFYSGTVGDSPFDAAFIDRIVGALGFAGAAVDTFFCDLNSHFIRN